MFILVRAALVTTAFWCAVPFTAVAEDATFYKLGRLRDFSGLVLRNGQFYASFSHVNPDDRTAQDWFGKIVKLSSKKSCKKTKGAEVGVHWTTNACASMRSNGGGQYSLSIVVRYDYRSLNVKDKEHVDILKSYDFVRERRYEIDFSVSGSKCSAWMVKRSCLPLDGTKHVASTVGDLGCSSKR